ncbi:MAG: hypothetical protein ACYDD4_14025 [Acidimicrobiales bacterium]
MAEVPLMAAISSHDFDGFDDAETGLQPVLEAVPEPAAAQHSPYEEAKAYFASLSSEQIQAMYADAPLRLGWRIRRRLGMQYYG